jgi:Zn-dependent peptidase ImmA (M78 family)
MDLKLYWGVSMQSLIYKAWEAGSISDRSKKYHFVQMSKRGFREREPVQVNAPESPSTLREVVSAHLGDLGYTPADLSEMFGLLEEEILRLYPVPRQKPQLRIVV